MERDYIVGVDLLRRGKRIATACVTIVLDGERRSTDVAEVANIVGYAWTLRDFDELFSDDDLNVVMPQAGDTTRVYSVYEEGRVS